MPSLSQSSAVTKTCRNMLVVPPFECAWLVDEKLRFAEPGRGCIAFEACADNDVTVVLKEKAGSKHYRTDMDPNYAIVLGSHKNRRIRIEVDGSTAFDAPGVVVSASQFERFWMSICDGHISVGKGDPGKGVLCEWTHSGIVRKVEYVGLSSWDKHVGYRNIQVFPYSKCLPPSIELAQFSLASGGLEQFLESSEFADIYFCVGIERRLVPAHRLVLACCCTKFSSSVYDKEGVVVMLPVVEYPVLHAFLQYLYSGRTQLSRAHLAGLRDLCKEFGLESLARHCELLQVEVDNGCALDSSFLIEHKTSSECPLERKSALSSHFPLSSSKLRETFSNSQFADVEISVSGSDVVVRAHKLMLSAWSIPFLKMFTNGMWESKLTKVSIGDTQPDVLHVMLQFMYNGHLDFDQNDDAESLLSLLVLADRFGIPLLQHACCANLIRGLSEELVCSVLHVAASLPCCELLQDACVEFFAKNFEGCVLHALDFHELDIHFLERIVQSYYLCVSTEEKVFNAIIYWGSGAKSINDWKAASYYLTEHSVEELFEERLDSWNEVLQSVRFALMAPTLLKEIQSCNLSNCLQQLKQVVTEALEYLAHDRDATCCQILNNRDRLVQLSESSVRFSLRPSNLKELLYICDGDSNGVIYYAGTSYGAHAWMNPALTKRISVVASSPPSRFTDAKALVSRQYQGTSFAGPCFDEGRPSSWWKIDLGEDHQLMCNHYTVRQDGSVNYLRSWSLQGSMDDKNWLDLRVHHEEKTLSRAGQFASWPIHAANAHTPLRFFRIILTGPTSSRSQPWNLCICYVELYGYLSKC